jgi:hypothetical protein
VSAVAVEEFIAAFQRFRPWMGWVTRVAGALLVVVGVLMILNYFATLSAFLTRFTPEALKNRL